MTDHSGTRHCGKCGKPVDQAAITCLHCDALLAAYEAPVGATSGTVLATTPVPIPDGSTSSATTRDGYARSAMRPAAKRAQAPVSDLHQTSPIAQAMERTRAVAREHEASNRRTPTPGAAPTGIAAKGPGRPGGPTRPTTPRGPGRPLEQGRLDHTDTVLPADQRPAGEITGHASSAQNERPRPTPAQRAARHTQRSVAADKELAQHRRVDGKSRPGAGSVALLVIGIILMVRVLSAAPIAGLVFIPIVIVVLTWFMTSVARSTGRKTTSMPKEKRDK